MHIAVPLLHLEFGFFFLAICFFTESSEQEHYFYSLCGECFDLNNGVSLQFTSICKCYCSAITLLIDLYFELMKSSDPMVALISDAPLGL